MIQDCEPGLHVYQRTPKIPSLRVRFAQQHVFPTGEPMLVATGSLHQFQRVLIVSYGFGRMVLRAG